MKFTIDIIKEYEAWEEENFINEDFLRNIIILCLNKANIKLAKAEIAILLCDENHIKQLNRDFLGKDYATNVLSFPDEFTHNDNISSEQEIRLGDIAFCYEVIRQEAISYNLSFKNHFTHMVVHAILHLVGYDHENDEDWEKMTNLEIEILKELKINKPPLYVTKT